MPQETVTSDEFFAKLASLGEDSVRVRLAIGEWGNNCDRSRLVELWLSKQDAARALEAAAKRDAREEATLAIARSAKASVRYDRYIAIAAVIIAAIAAREDIKWLAWSVISWLR